MIPVNRWVVKLFTVGKNEMETIYKVGSRITLFVFVVSPTQFLSLSQVKPREYVTLIFLLVSHPFTLPPTVVLVMQV